LNRYALKIKYNGTNFCGWQIQDNLRTVQSELEKAIKIFTKQNVRVIASGRTDTGVHALNQVIHCDMAGDFDLKRLCIALNGIMPDDVSVSNAYIVEKSFHSRFSAISREYFYKIYNSPLRSPFMRYAAMWVNEPLNVKFISDSLKNIEGEHDFASFCKKKSANESTIRKIIKTLVLQQDNEIILKIRGNAFLHNMIRILVGTIINMHANDKNPDDLTKILEKRDRTCAGPTAPPYGLYLADIEYPENGIVIEAAYAERL
jgi:tRNA pseudouridine38-40 synthase